MLSGLLAATLLAGCAQPVQDAGSPMNGLHACPGAGSVIGVFTGQSPTATPGDSPAAMQHDTWALEVNGQVRRLTRDGMHTGAVISPDGRSAYQLRSSGRILGDSTEAPAVIERLDLSTGQTSRIAELPAILDLTISGDGRRLAVARTVEAHPDTGLDVNSVTMLDLSSPGEPVTLPQAPDARPDLYSVVTQVSLAPDGQSLAYVLGLEVRPHTVVYSLHTRDLETGVDHVAYTAQGTDFLSDVTWSSDGTVVLAALRVQESGDTVESPARFRAVRLDVPTGKATVSDGLAPQFSPVSADGARVVGFVPGPDGDRRNRALIAWDRNSNASDRLPVGQDATGISVAPCSYR